MDQFFIYKYLSGEASAEETERLYNWIRESDASRVEFIRLKNLWIASGIGIPDKAKYLSEDLQKIKDRIHSERKRHTGKTYSWFWKAASILIIPLTILCTLYFTGNREKEVILAYNEVFVPNREKATVMLSDGSRITLNSDSYLRYPASFSEGVRNVFLEGEAFFEIDQEHDRPFVVNTEELDVRVTGTVFNISAYPDDQTVSATLVSGKVHVMPKELKMKRGKAVELKPNQRLVYKKLDHTMDREMVNTEIFTSWTRGEYIFQNETLGTILNTIERWYDIQVLVNAPGIEEHRLSGRFRDDEPLHQVFEVIKLTTPIQYTLKDKVVVISNTD